MPRHRVIILQTQPDDPATFNCVMWADVPVARQARYASVDKVSAWSDATTEDNAALQSGAVVEEMMIQRVPDGSTLPQIEAHLQSKWTVFQDRVNNRNPWQRYGSTWDGTNWVVLNNG